MAAVKRRRFLGIIARWTLVVLLFAQGALVAEACLRTDASPRAAFSMPDMEGCDMGKTNLNACLLGYLDLADQSTVQPSVPPATSYILVTPHTAGRLPAFDARAALPPPGNALPIPIRYCTLLI